MEETPEADTAEVAAAARNLRLLRRLVTLLTVAMIVGIVAVVGLMAAKLTEVPPPLLPETITLPQGAKPRAVTVGEGWFLVVTDRDEVLVFDRTTGRLRQTLRIAD